MDSNYIKIFTGSFINAQRIVGELREIGIEAVVKDETESARLAGFASAIQGEQELYVNQDEADRAFEIVEKLLAEQK